MLIDIKYFTKGSRQIMNAVDNPATANEKAVAVRVEGYIVSLEEKYLRLMVGKDLASEVSVHADDTEAIAVAAVEDGTATEGDTPTEEGTEGGDAGDSDGGDSPEGGEAGGDAAEGGNTEGEGATGEEDIPSEDCGNTAVSIFKIVADKLRESFADYVHYHMLRDMNTTATITGGVQLKSGNTPVHLIVHQAAAWNRMVQRNVEFVEWAKSDECPLSIRISKKMLTYINAMNL